MSWVDQIKHNSQDLISLLPRFVMHPVRIMKSPPDWDWPLVLVFQAALAASAGLLAGIIAQSFWAIIANLFLFPISTLLIQILVTGAVYVLLQSQFHVVSPISKIYIVVMCAQIPFILFRILSPLGIPHDLIGVGGGLALLTVGLVENFRLPKHRVIRWTGGAYAAFFVIWMAFVIIRSHSEISYEKKLQPAAIEQMEKNLSK